ncbi:DNA-binding protein [Sulfurospirillum barnesii]|uniref:Putative metal-binding protein, possibly nucleic-acid binding protein n=1 Tax=Sulfurospirillum barnesii (strain ATCC 700032 / DSM 10660 / SES-3) TaxID=760154 RepID=I3XUE7_SULBS|nr:DNA-binding protein [Sulfurospirillum barnesii]AFL67571.1 putative metal-binding protein, possibly nucleic-acid binding protein [Sulfurospirillum barnesii SES-3]
MQIEFKKIPSSGIHFETSLDEIKFSGEAVKTGKILVKCKGVIEGTLLHTCDRCGESFVLTVNENVEVFASDGLYEDKEGEELLNVIEFFDSFIEVDTLLQSEIEAFKSDYHYCGQCEQL